MRSITDTQALPTHERGWALVSVLWVVTGLSLLAASAEVLSANTYRLERKMLYQGQAEAAVDAGITRAVLGIEAPDTSDRWPTDGTPQTFLFQGVTLKISVQDELGRFDLNAVDGSVLVSLFHSQGAALDKAQTLSDRTLDWRGSPNGDLHRLHGATDGDYAAAGLPYRPRHTAFQSVDELRLVLGMPPDLFDRVRPALTVYTKKPMIDPNIATREALLALYGGNSEQVENVMQSRATGIAASIGQNVTDPSLALAGRTFSVAIRTDIDHHHYARDAVIMLTSNQQRPYLTLAWQ